MTRRWFPLTASIVLACAVRVSAQTPGAPAPGEYGRAAKLDVQAFESPNHLVRLEFPKKDWEAVLRNSVDVIPGATAPIVTLVQRKREASIVVEQTKLHQALAREDITDLFSQLEVDSLKERQPLAADVSAKLVDAGARRLVILSYTRQGVAGAERIRQYSIPSGADLYRVTCVASASQFARYEPVFAHVAASFTATGGGTQ